MDKLGPYRVLGEVARGGAGAVFRGVGPDGRAVALKLLLAGKAATPTQRGRFQAEARALRTVAHPGVVALLDSGEHEGTPWLALEWVEGETLAERVTRQGPLQVDEALELIASLAAALAHCHARGVLHRDLKPDNVLVRADSGQPCLTDFGLARLVLPEEGGLTTSGSWLGTPGWWPPEQARGQLAKIGPASDVYGLGALLFGLLTARVPQEGQDLHAMLRALDLPPTPPSRHRPGLPAWIDALVVRAMDPDPARRPADAAAFAALLARGAPPVRRRWPVGLSAAALLAIALAAPLGWRAWQRHRAETHLRAALELARTRHGEEALGEAELAAALAPDWPEALIRRGWLRLQVRGDVQSARDDLRRALERGPPDSPALTLRGILHRLDGEHDLARQDFDRAAALAPEEPGPRAQRAILRYDQGDARGALEDLDFALERLEVLEPLLLFQRARARLVMGDPSGALSDCRRGLELEPDLALLWNISGLARRHLRQLPEALADLDRAVALNEGLLPARFNRATVRFMLGQNQPALDDLEFVLTRAPGDGEALAARGAIRMELGDREGGRQDLERAAELRPGDADTITERGKARFLTDDPELADQDFTRALTLRPDHVDARLARAKLRLSRRDLDGAQADLDVLFRLAPDHADGHITRGAVLVAQRDIAGGIAEFERALELAPGAEWAGEVRREIERQRARLRR